MMSVYDFDRVKRELFELAGGLAPQRRFSGDGGESIDGGGGEGCASACSRSMRCFVTFNGVDAFANADACCDVQSIKDHINELMSGLPVFYKRDIIDISINQTVYAAKKWKEDEMCGDNQREKENDKDNDKEKENWKEQEKVKYLHRMINAKHNNSRVVLRAFVYEEDLMRFFNSERFFYDFIARFFYYVVGSGSGMHNEKRCN